MPVYQCPCSKVHGYSQNTQIERDATGEPLLMAWSFSRDWPKALNSNGEKEAYLAVLPTQPEIGFLTIPSHMVVRAETWQRPPTMPWR